MRDLIRQLVLFGLLVSVIGVSLAYVDYKWIAPNRVPPCKQDELPEGHVCLKTVQAEWGDRIIWVDARGEDAFERGSVNRMPVLPIRNDVRAQELLAAALPVLLEADMNDQCIVIFCDRDCNSSADVASILEQYDLDAPDFVLEGGWVEIKMGASLVP